MRSLALPLLCALICALAAPAVHAAGFDEASGTVTTDGAAFSVSFDDAASLADHAFQGYDAFTQQSVDEAALGERIRQDGDALEGDGAIAFGGDVNWITMDVSSLTSLVGRRVEFHYWQKPEGTRVIGTIAWYAGDRTNPLALGSVTFQPTGKATDDGWEEWTSGPVDFAWAEQIPATDISFVDENLTGAYGGLAENRQARALVDALYAVDVGPALVPAAACTLESESTTCGDTGLCHYGRCVDAAIRVGQPLLDGQLRRDYVERRIFEVSLFEGGRAPEGRAGLVRDALTPLEDEPKPATFWPTFTEAYTLLVDGHASAPMLGYPAYLNAGVCVNLGVADLLPGAPTVPLVFEAGANVVGAQLEPGDALTAIDGVPVEDWAAAAGRLIQHPGDPAGRAVVTAPQIFVAALDTGAVATFERCSHTDGTPCDASEVETITVDLKSLVGDAVLAGQTPVGYGDNATCDYRFVRPVPSGSVQNTDYAFAGHADDGDTRFLLINGVPGQQDQGGPAWFNAVDAALRDDPRKLVLDERTGDGGGIDAVDWIGGALSAPGDLYAMDFLPGIESDDLAGDRSAIVDCSTSADAQSIGCGNGFRWMFGATSGNKLGEAKDSKLAVLIGLDVSGNDYLTKILKHRSGETRVFGSGSTWGAFGVIWQMAAHLGELSGGSLQVQDTLFMASADDGNTAFPTSTGERPDEEVLEKQSDAVAGTDTALAAAQAWLAQ